MEQHYIEITKTARYYTLGNLNKQTKAVKIFFTNVLVKDDNAHLINLPDVIDVWFPSCVNCKPDKRKKH